ncbi:MAG: hypothetical protein HY907_10685 [Deltaproteobacteria bacterium]|nr:hypothetical protein [Deltaproteobacteria bacterium]
MEYELSAGGIVRNREPHTTEDRQLLAVADALRALDPGRFGARNAMLLLGPAPVPPLLVPAFANQATGR